jgi:hypothetical protein
MTVEQAHQALIAFERQGLRLQDQLFQLRASGGRWFRLSGGRWQSV